MVKEFLDWKECAKEMTKAQIASRGIRDKALLEAMTRVPRHLFVPEELRHQAYDDMPLPIGAGQTISQPYMVAKMTLLLAPKAGDKILEIGTGSGYQAAVLAELGARVWSVERIPALAERAREVLCNLGYGDRVTVICGDGRSGYPEAAPYDGVIVTAAASVVEPAWKEQLAEGGRLIVPLAQGIWGERLLLCVKKAHGFDESYHDYCRFVPLLPGVADKKNG